MTRREENIINITFKAAELIQNEGISVEQFGGSEGLAEDIASIADAFDKSNKSSNRTEKDSEHKSQIDQFAETELLGMSRRSLPTFIFDDEFIINKDYESINGYLIATDYLVDTFLNDKNMVSINFYANYNVITKEIDLAVTYYTLVLGEVNQTNVDIFLSQKEKLALTKALEFYCQQHYGISCYQFVAEAQKDRIDETVKNLYRLDSDNSIELYASYQDTADFLHETLYENRKDKELSTIILEQIDEAFSQERWQEEDTVLEKAGVLGTEFEEDCRWYFRDIYPIMSPFNHFLSQDIKVNILLATPDDQKNDCCSIHEQYLAMTDPGALTRPEEALNKETAITWLVKQQGHTLEELKSVLEEYTDFFNRPEIEALPYDLAHKIFVENHNEFLSSICEELENHTYYHGALTVLAEMSISDFISMQEGNKNIVLSPRSTIGIFNPWNGSGSLLEIQLEKPLTFTTDMIHDVQIEGVKPDNSYTVNQVYGLVGSCWKSPTAIEVISSDIEKEKTQTKPWEPPKHEDKTKSHSDDVER